MTSSNFISTISLAEYLCDVNQEDILSSVCSASESTESEDEESESALNITLNHNVDMFVHELTKLFGYLGTPEYCCGTSAFVFF